MIKKINKDITPPNTMYVNKATVCVFESFVIRANICTFIAAKLSQIALFTYIRSLFYPKHSFKKL